MLRSKQYPWITLHSVGQRRPLLNCARCKTRSLFISQTDVPIKSLIKISKEFDIVHSKCIGDYELEKGSCVRMAPTEYTILEYLSYE